MGDICHINRDEAEVSSRSIKACTDVLGRKCITSDTDTVLLNDEVV